jgi:hypothetical protein
MFRSPARAVPFDPVNNSGAGFAEAGEVMLPDTLLFEAAKEAFDEAVLFGGVGCDELLRQMACPSFTVCSNRAIYSRGSAKSRSDLVKTFQVPIKDFLEACDWNVGARERPSSARFIHSGNELTDSHDRGSISESQCRAASRYGL